MALLLASGSPIRAAMLRNAGVPFEVIKAPVDEAAIKAAHDEKAERLTVRLAEAKALAASGRESDDWVIGSDSMVTVDGRKFDKPENRDQAAEHLRFFSGKAMRLSSAAALARGGQVDWSHGETATLHMRELTDRFIEEYLDADWPEVSYCVGVFRMEGPGVQLFERIEGSHFTILGMPMLPLLGALRERGALTS